jgi:hypothetical protein
MTYLARNTVNMESPYSLYCLLRRVTTPHIFYSGESLLTAKSFLITPLSFEGTMKQKQIYARITLLTKNILKE